MYLEVSSRNDPQPKLAGFNYFRTGVAELYDQTLLIRESLQNSLGAAIQGSPEVQVEFRLSDWKSEDIGVFLDTLTGSGFCDDARPETRAALNRFRYSASMHEERLRRSHSPVRILEIRDEGTVGLNGRYNDSESNFHRLVCRCGATQGASGKGGSQGVGKSVYFAAGEGVVVFYSRFRDADGALKSRLTVLCAEDYQPTKNHHNWFSEYEGQQPDDCRGPANLGLMRWLSTQDAAPFELRPECGEDADSCFVTKLLSSLGVKPFEGEQTGTSIVIPFVRDGVFGDDFDEFANLIRMYYAPRLAPCPDRFKSRQDIPAWLNVVYRGPDHVERRVTVVEDSVAELVRNLFFSAMDGRELSWRGFPIIVRAAKSETLDQTLGHLAWIKVETSALSEWPMSLAEEDSSGSSFKTQFANPNPMVLCVRRFGQILSWRQGKRKTWELKKVAPPAGYSLIPMFVPTNTLVPRWLGEPLRSNADDVLRSVETGVHDAWEFALRAKNDVKDHKANEIYKAFRQTYKELESSVDVPVAEKTVSQFAPNFTSLLGARGNPDGGSGGGGSGGGGVSRGAFVIQKIVNLGDGRSRIVFTLQSDDRFHKLEAVTPSGGFRSYSKDKVGERFPLLFERESLTVDGVGVSIEDLNPEDGPAVVRFRLPQGPDCERLGNIVLCAKSGVAQTFGIKHSVE